MDISEASTATEETDVEDFITEKHLISTKNRMFW